MKYKAILWDADGVVLKSGRRFSEQLEAVYGIPAAKLLPFFHGIFVECSIGKADLKVELAKLIGEWGWKGTVDELMEFWFTTGTLIDAEVADYIRTFTSQGVRCFLTTDQEKYRGEFLKSQLVPDLLEEIFYSAKIGCKKKDPGFFEYVDKTIGVPKDQVLFIDDDEKNVETANAFGYNAHFFTSLDELKRFLNA